MPVVDMRVRIPVPLTSEYIATGAITTEKIADDVITTEKLADSAVTLSKMHSVSRTAHFIGDDTEVSTTSTDWDILKRFRFTKSSDFNWEHIWFKGEIKTTTGTVTVGIFIDEEVTGRASVSSTSTTYDVVDADCSIADLPHGTYTVNLKMKVTTGATGTTRTNEFYFTRGA